MYYAGGTPGFYAPGGFGNMSPKDKDNYFSGSYGHIRIPEYGRQPSRSRGSYERYSPKANYYYGQGKSLNDYLYSDYKSEQPNDKNIPTQPYNPEPRYNTDPVGDTIPINLPVQRNRSGPYLDRTSKGKNKYGDPVDTVYAGGSPSFNEKTGRYEDYTGADGTVTRAKPQPQKQGRMAGDIFNRDFQPGPARGNDVRDIRGTNDSRNNKGETQIGIGDFMREQISQRNTTDNSGPSVRTFDFRDNNNNGIDDRDE